ncbi:oxidative stress-responsive serine-rich protein 1-like [Sphaeramia orbicularis]|uniref:oxidative stress-responsive serine-rich protein 1-like n=1 Tax=Sphaeramia orbicularis TaxID=375764 RepID=UPI0011802699|nr:oxidative stress-responsive serine-rich protein 1-like [Sphaeramia orbicularis]
MEAGGKDCEDETLQSAFKKLRVDAESLPAAVSASEASAPRGASRACLDTGGAKPKLGCTKDNWHGCSRKSSRGASRTQRRRRSKSPILHPPKFTYCSAATASSGCLKQQRLAVPDLAEPCPAVDGRTLSSRAAAPPAHTDLPPPGTHSHMTHPLVFGSSARYDTRVIDAAAGSTPSSPQIPATAPTVATPPGDARSSEDGGPQKSACDGAERGGAAEASDFRALSNSSRTAPGLRPPCSCARTKASDSQPENPEREAEPQCRCRARHVGWNDVEVYSFTGLRDVISECERTLASPGDALRTVSTTANPNTSASPASAPASSGSPRSCSEQARAYVDDITIDDLSGYMEYYLYIPKKMSHMAEMMYT